MIRGDTPATGTGLLQAPGVSDIVALVEPELMALHGTIAASGVPLHELTRLGRGAQAFNTIAAPIALLAQVANLPEAHTELMLPGLFQSPSRPETYRSVRGVPNSWASSAPARSLLSPHISGTDATARQSRPVMPQSLATARQEGTTQFQARATPGEPGPAVPTLVEPGAAPQHPVIAATAAHDIIGTTPARCLEANLSQFAVAPGRLDETTGITQTQKQGARVSGTAQGEVTTAAIAPQAMLASAPSDSNIFMTLNALPPDRDISATQDVRSFHDDIPGGQNRQPADRDTQATADAASINKGALGASMAPRATIETMPESAGPPSDSAVTDEPRIEPVSQQGTIVLAGAQLARWMIDQLERRASRPGAMTTGIDPRMTATFPGAPTGT